MFNVHNGCLIALSYYYEWLTMASSNIPSDWNIRNASLEFGRIIVNLVLDFSGTVVVTTFTFDSYFLNLLWLYLLPNTHLPIYTYIYRYISCSSLSFPLINSVSCISWLDISVSFLLCDIVLATSYSSSSIFILTKRHFWQWGFSARVRVLSNTATNMWCGMIVRVATSRAITSRRYVEQNSYY